MPDGSPDAEGPDPNQPHRDIARWTKAVAWFTFFLVLVSGTADWFIYQQYRVANEAQRDTREQLRAVVTQYGGEFSVIHGPTADRPVLGINFAARFQNTGGTRTAWFHGWMSAHYFGGAEPPNNLDFGKPYDVVNEPDTVIAAGVPFELGIATIPAADAQKLLARQGVGLVWGRAEYADIFDQTVIHHISFCMLVKQPDGAPEGALPTMTQYRSDCNTHD